MWGESIMAGHGLPPKLPSQRRRRNPPTRGEYSAVAAIGWQHGPIPKPPSGLGTEARLAWSTWMASWVAAHWHPGDLPQLRVLVRLFDQVSTGVASTSLISETRSWMDGYGITPKGQQDRRWVAPKASDASGSDANPYGRLLHVVVPVDDPPTGSAS